MERERHFMEVLREQILCDQRNLVYRQLVATKFLELNWKERKNLAAVPKSNNLIISADGSG